MRESRHQVQVLHSPRFCRVLPRGGSTINPENTPMPIRIFQDAGNTQTGGNVEGIKGASDNSGQKPGVSTRRDSHGAVVHPNKKYVYIIDRIQNVVEVFDTTNFTRSSFDLVSRQTGRSCLLRQSHWHYS